MIIRFIVLTLLLQTAICHGQQQKSALFLGNSYTYVNDLPNLISQIAASKGDQFTHQQNTPGGAGFNTHRIDSTSQALLQNATYDYLILQGQSAELSLDLMGEGKHRSPNFYTAEYLDHVKQMNDTCAQTLLYMTWGYNFSPESYLSMQQNVSESYQELAHTLDAAVAPVGEAWKTIIQNHPGIPLHSQDESHPNLAGSYLAACVFYTSIFRNDPTGAWAPMGLTPTVAGILQQTAYATVTDSLAKWNMKKNKKFCQSASFEHHNQLWEKLNTGTTQTVNNIQFVTDDVAFARVSFPNGLITTRNKGETWDNVVVPIDNLPFETHFVTDSIGFFVSSGFSMDSSTLDTNTNNPWGTIVTADHYAYPRLFKTMDAGDSWFEIPLDTTAFGVKYNGFVNTYFIETINLHFNNEDEGTILYSQYAYAKDTIMSLKTSNGGQQWEHFRNQLPEMYLAPTMISSDTVYMSSTETNGDDTLEFWRSTDGGANWELYAPLTFNCCKSGPVPQYAKIVHPTQGGIMVANPLYSPLLLVSKGPGSTWDTVAIASLMGRLNDLVEVSDNQMFGIFDNPLLHRIGVSNDGGISWDMESFHDVTLFDLTHTSEYIYAAGNQGTILRRKRDVPDGIDDSPIIRESIRVFPNPTRDRLYLQLLPDQSFPVQLTIYDMAGKQVDQVELNSEDHSYSTAPLRSGIFFYHVNFLSGSKKPAQGKFVVLPQ